MGNEQGFLVIKRFGYVESIEILRKREICCAGSPLFLEHRFNRKLPFNLVNQWRKQCCLLQRFQVFSTVDVLTTNKDLRNSYRATVVTACRIHCSRLFDVVFDVLQPFL